MDDTVKRTNDEKNLQVCLKYAIRKENPDKAKLEFIQMRQNDEIIERLDKIISLLSGSKPKIVSNEKKQESTEEKPEKVSKIYKCDLCGIVEENGEIFDTPLKLGRHKRECKKKYSEAK